MNFTEYTALAQQPGYCTTVATEAGLLHPILSQ